MYKPSRCEAPKRLWTLQPRATGGHTVTTLVFSSKSLTHRTVFLIPLYMASIRCCTWSFCRAVHGTEGLFLVFKYCEHVLNRSAITFKKITENWCMRNKSHLHFVRKCVNKLFSHLQMFCVLLPKSLL